MTMTNHGVQHSYAEDLQALKAVSRIDPADQPALIERLLRNPSPAIRGPAVRLGAALLSDDRITSYLRDGTDDVLRNAGLEMLKSRGSQAVSLGVSLLSDRDGDVVLQAVLLLDHLRDPRSLEPLRGALSHPNPNVVQAAILAIGHLGHAGAVGDLLRFLHSDLWLQMAAIEALGDLRAQEAVVPLSELLRDTIVESLAAESLARIGGSDAFRRLVIHWVESNGERDTQLELIAHVLEGASDPPRSPAGARQLLKAKMRGDDRGSRVSAARCLLALGPSDADQDALAVLADAWVDRGTLPSCLRRRADLVRELLVAGGIRRGWGFRLVAKFPEAAPMDALAAALAETSDHEHLDAAVDALYHVAEPRLCGTLVTLYGRLPQELRVGLTQLLTRYREAIAPALEEVDIPQEIRQVLTTVSADDDAAVQMIVALPRIVQMEALSHVEHRDALVRKLPWLEWLESDVDAYGSHAAKLADRAIQAAELPAVRLLLHQRPSRNLIRLVANLRDGESVPLLRALIRSEPTLGPYALAALGSIGGTEARAIVRRLATNGSQWSRFAYRALADCCTEEDLPVFRGAAFHEDWHVRMVCVTVLGRACHSDDIPTIALLTADPVAAVADRARSFFHR